MMDGRVPAAAKVAWRKRLRDAWRALDPVEREAVSAAICRRLQDLLERSAPAACSTGPTVAAGLRGAGRPHDPGGRPGARDAHPSRATAAPGAPCGRVLPPVRAVMLYAPLPTEIDVTPLLDWARSRGLEVLVPWVDPARHVMEARAVAGWDDLVPGPWGLRQPAARCPSRQPGAETVIVVPGLAFDREGWRLGRGGGYYDRFLDRWPAAWRAGVAPARMVVPHLPRDPHDRRMDLVVTEAEVLGPWWGVR
ncbi:5-formyltetrahydrofolate cyclo-ligase [Thermaerobacter marianensis DSM 12885]|uniref:5-formyltetrahydrofolate cyclo-ligase n=2 Tax=Thermaerobacter marianensis TaxID=73919 RepID=E6SIX9_THEM7|nr:5-formyltetrahydrofolate cyclo-ligase [Thermaerobacter marianensis DSM 12885]